MDLLTVILNCDDCDMDSEGEYYTDSDYDSEYSDFEYEESKDKVKPVSSVPKPPYNEKTPTPSANNDSKLLL
jgi:hypothetical protein